MLKGIAGLVGHIALVGTTAAALVAVAHSPSLAASRLIYDSEYEAIGYEEESGRNPVARLAERIEAGEVTLDYEKGHGYLPSLLQALGIDESSQLLVYSKSSLQYPLISAATPRALYFNDQTYIGWVQGSTIVEIATMDEKHGTVFYIFNNKPKADKFFDRETGSCLSCHDTYGNMGGGVPELLARSFLVDADGLKVSKDHVQGNTNDATPFEERWGGWYVTGQHGDQGHLGNILVGKGDDPEAPDTLRHGNIDTLAGQGLFDTEPYMTPTSDVVALMVLEHQLTVQNEITYVKFKTPAVLGRIGHPEAVEAERWEDLPEMAQRVLPRMLDKLVGALTLRDAVSLDAPISGNPDYQAWFEAQGPKDAAGRSLRTLDLENRLFKHDLSYLIYSADFDTLPGFAKDYVFTRLAADLGDTEAAILAETKPEFTAYLPAP